ncbi:hypothetical protein PMI14_01402 [Acidovorax sp. CF316]|uniref:bluetail domain-containing putative surface protein n=1 Tax=Acidovorax sp. CF316 TaxID=1144317 RepID=UPI00026BCF08|nr:bluetail domain-containing putative surface protein [Acidovorax sp. CF316]EJE53703.1 hypothetical protein PMI14_01402 [Acidovorax sp. CF316]
MPSQISGAYADVSTLFRVFYDASPSQNTYTYYIEAINSTGVSAVARAFTGQFQDQTEGQLSTMLLARFGLLPNAPLRAELTNYMTTVGKANAGIVALQLSQILSGLENATGDLAVYAPAAVRWNNELAASHLYSSDPATNRGPDQMYVPGVGVTLSLTDGNDVLSPEATQRQFQTTGNHDTILALVPGQLASADAIEDPARIDLDVLKAGLAGGERVTPALRYIEKVVITAGAAAQFDASRSVGTLEAWIDSAAGAVGFSGLELRTTVGIQNSLGGGILTVGYRDTSGASDTAYIAFADATGADEVVVAGVENIKVRSEAGTVAETTANSARITAASAEQIVITGGQALNTTVTGAHVAVIDATYMTGALGLTFATTGLMSVGIAGGSGADRFIINDASGARVVIEAGDGADTVTVGAGNAHRIALGGGADVLNITALAGAAARDLDIGTAAALGRCAIEVTDFVSGTDVIQLTSATPASKSAPSAAQLASITASSSLLEAASLAATTAGANKAIAFRYGADTYILVNDGAAALGENDSLVKLTGVAALADASWTTV